MYIVVIAVKQVNAMVNELRLLLFTATTVIYYVFMTELKKNSLYTHCRLTFRTSYFVKTPVYKDYF